jgi:hypothetical protein
MYHTPRIECKLLHEKILGNNLVYYNFYCNFLETDVIVYVAFWWVGAILLSVNSATVRARIACPSYACIANEGGYMTCLSSGTQKLNSPCNCCYAPKGCTIYYASGASMCTATAIGAWRDGYAISVKHGC